MEDLQQLLPIIIPIFLIQVILAITALVHVLKHPNYKFSNKIMWVIIVLFIQMIGPIIYFLFGRGEEE
ncbi:PLD nuclease N-terminal domain-containing protein [Kurthia zopfii]|uniref:PLD nuclease N-terminal domain-containing protein n=1 Tax=Kurthia zopfii TaxID=1650 RepID=UPI000F6F1578|nr:PLD nuclease N-terminal domain-containing protein [Kurthia zopfii]VEI08262.1 Negative regulatory protein yxlE [Kurthia zopfii]